MLEPKEQGESMIFRFLTDDDGTVLTDIVCPVACGRCCEYWTTIPEFENFKGISNYRFCPYLKMRGCKLKRSKRPIECKIYLCELGALACEKLVTRAEIDRTIDMGQQTNAFKFLGREIKPNDSGNFVVSEEFKQLVKRKKEQNERAKANAKRAI